MLVKLLHRFSQEHLVKRLNGAMGVQLDEETVRSALDMNPEIAPYPHAIGARRIDSREVSIVNARKESEFALFPIEPKRTLDDQQVFLVVTLFIVGGQDTVIMRLGIVGRRRVVKTVNNSGLSAIRRRGHGEVGITAG